LKAEDLAQGVADWDACFASGQALAEISDKAENFRAAILRDKKTRKGKTPPEHAFFEAAEKLWQRRDTLEAELEQQRLALFRDFLAWATPEMQTRKRARRQVDYDDLLGNLHRALTGARGAALAASLRTRYPAALIDEFQDTDPLQFEIFQTLYANRDNPAFLVGDPKQAIYSFRQADLHTYLAARKEARARYWLQDNQRSCPGVIAGVNALFSANPQAFMLAGLDFLAASRGAKPLPVLFDSSDIERGAFHFWQLPAGEAALDKASALQRTAEATAAEIARLLAAARRREICVGDSPLPPKRIAILVRTHRQGWLIKEALAAVGVQAAELAQDDVFLSAEAEDLERLLLALLEPARLGALKAALATPLFGLNAHDIAALNEEEAALNAWLERFARWHRLWQKRGVLAALNRVGQERQFAARLLALPEGERRLTNHLHLVELLHRMEDQTPQAARLLREFSRKRQAGVEGLDETAQLRLESDRDLVSIVTIHRAKGLEYDIVFCPFLWEGGGQPSGQALPGQFYHDGDGRLRLDYRPEGEAAKQAARQEQAAEWLRLYYVALTRPVHRCYLVWGDYTLRGSRVESARSLLNWLVAGAGYQPEAWLTADGKTLPDAAALKTAWQTLIAGLDASTEALPETGLAGQTRRVAEEAAEDYAAAVAHRALTPGFRIDSFSSLIRHGDFSAREGEGKAQDDLPDLPSLPDAPERLAAQMAQRAQTSPDDILHFPRGPQAGDCIHDFLERLDFDRPESHAFAADLALSRHPPGDPERKADHPAMLKTLATNLAATPLPLPGCRTPFLLHTLTPERRLVELEFYLPVARLDAHVLQNIMTAHGEPVPRLDFPAAHGFLKGYIDLIFAHEGRYYVLDWKSNHLGWTPEDYSDAALREAMGAHGYTLQARLYLLALHRYLKCRLPDYTPAQHLGGACYLFLRGVRPDWQQPNGLPTGVCLLSPKGELVLEMERALG
ncbi:MAG: UvrD-helicase domain-containing protein, partial [Zoogloeaceae bacterium]|nr:UvrD-helicase domain-containing protein [Zoogloeaceae bacterium]